MINGVLNVWKEAGFTSHDVVAKLRGILHQKKIGHTGTLDPDATGVLPVCLGKGTRLCDMMIKEQELPELIKRAEESGLPEDTQKAKDLAELCNRFEKKIYDLELTRTISMQMAPQIRLIQSNDTAMSEKIQSTLVNTIPLWKSQMVLAIGVEHSAQAAKAQREVTDMTNTLLKKNAETLKLATVETAKESERGIVDIETLKQTNETLISTLDEVLQIQEDGRNKRREAEAELTQIETTMRNKLMEMSRTK